MSRLPVFNVNRALERRVPDARGECAPQQPAIPLWLPQTSSDSLRLRSSDDPRAPRQLAAAHLAQTEKVLHQADSEGLKGSAGAADRSGRPCAVAEQTRALVRGLVVPADRRRAIARPRLASRTPRRSGARPLPADVRKQGRSISSSTAEASAASSLSGTSRPWTPWVSMAGTPPMRVATTGRPLANASSTESGMLSIAGVCTYMSASA